MAAPSGRSRIQNAQTKHYLISDGKESDGSVVATVPENEYHPDTTVLLIHASPSKPGLILVESGRVNGLYVGHRIIDGVSFLSWTAEQVQWFITGPLLGGHYNINASLQDLFWVDQLHTARRIALKPKNLVQDREDCFRVTSAKK